MADWRPWLPFLAACLHIFEEFVFPGGFTAWYRSYRPDASRITTRFLVIVNAALLVACLNIAKLKENPVGLAYWLTISAVLGTNGAWHAWATYKLKRYSPGVITGVLLYVPLAVYGYLQWVRPGAVSAGTAIVAYAIGGGYHVWSAAYHRTRHHYKPPTHAG